MKITVTVSKEEVEELENWQTLPDSGTQGDDVVNRIIREILKEIKLRKERKRNVQINNQA